MIGDSVYVVERTGSSRFSTPEIVDVYQEKSAASEFCARKNGTNKSNYVYTFRMKKVK